MKNMNKIAEKLLNKDAAKQFLGERSFWICLNYMFEVGSLEAKKRNETRREL